VQSGTLSLRNRVNGGSQHEDANDSKWQLWLEQHGPRFLLFARYQARCEADAQDLVQEAIFESLERRPDGEPPPSALVFATIRRRAVDLARRTDSRKGREMAVAQDYPELWFDSRPEDRERDLFLQQAMNKLPAIHRDVITLKVWGGLTFAEIAATLEIPPNTAASRYRYGLAELRNLTRQIFL
jgi:RNA polymerase sigma-70 factor (ECF subfamily)